MSDRYANFAELAAVEREGLDFRILVRALSHPTVIMAPHGGAIEAGTTEIAAALAGDDFSLYAFDGMKRRNNRDLHITSAHFDEPRGLRLIGNSRQVVTVHGEGSAQDAVFLGGRDRETRERLRVALGAAGFVPLEHDDPELQGVDPANVCNRGATGAGMQFELSLGLRQSFFESLTSQGRKNRTLRLAAFVSAVRAGLSPA